MHMDNYLIGEKIDIGTYGKVYKVMRIDTNKKYAMKMFKCNDDDIVSSGVLRELCALKTLKHSYIVELLDIFMFEKNDRNYISIILELCDINLDKYVKDNIPDRHTAITRFMMILSALNYMNSMGYVHGDLSPTNIMICGSDIKLIDFNFSRKIHRKYLRQLPPTINVCPIEIILNKNPNLLKIDTWSLAAIYYLLTTHENLINVRSDNIDEYMKEINEKFGNLSSKINDKLIKRMFQFDNKKRPTVTEIFTMLKPDMLDRHININEPVENCTNYPHMTLNIKLDIIHFIIDIIFKNNLNFEILVVTFENIMRLYKNDKLGNIHDISNIRIMIFIMIWMVSKVISDKSWNLDSVYDFFKKSGIMIDKENIRIIHNKLLIDLDWNIDPITMYSDVCSFSECYNKYYNMLTFVFILSDFYEKTSIENKIFIVELIMTDFLKLKNTKKAILDMNNICEDIKKSINIPIIIQYAKINGIDDMLKYLNDLSKN